MRKTPVTINGFTSGSASQYYQGDGSRDMDFSMILKQKLEDIRSEH